MVILLTFTLYVFGGDFEKGFIAYENGHYKKAVEYYQKAIKNEDAKALFFLGVMYGYGRGVSKNMHKMVQLYEQSASKGFSPAQFKMFLIYLTDNKGINRRNKQKAVMYLKLSAAQGFPRAVSMLAREYEDGLLLKRNLHKAAMLWKQLADNGDGEACCKVSGIYDKGKGVEQNKRIAKKYYSKAISFDAICAPIKD